VICTIAGEFGLLTYQLCGLTLMYWNWLQEVGMIFGWLYMVSILKIKTFFVYVAVTLERFKKTFFFE